MGFKYSNEGTQLNGADMLTRLTKDEFGDWRENNEAFCRRVAGASDEAKEMERFKEVYWVVYGKLPHPDFNKHWKEIVDNPVAIHSQEAWGMFAQGVNFGRKN